MSWLEDDYEALEEERPPRVTPRRMPTHQPELILEEASTPITKSRKKERPPRPPRDKDQPAFPHTWVFIKTGVLTLLAALLVATIFSYWTPEEGFETENFRAQMRIAQITQQPLQALLTPIPTERVTPKVGIIAGHSGPPQDPSFTIDPGAVCDDNNDGIAELTELEINTDIARMVANKLLTLGYEVELLEEFDPRLENYRADALLSIHTNDCRDYGLGATGYNVAGPFARGVPRGDTEAFVTCIINEYGEVTSLPRHFGVTEDMSEYHTFDEVHYDTPIAIIEIGFMFADRVMVTQSREALADGIVMGILCFMEPETYRSPTIGS